ncbi:copper resistance CopC family protein [Amycolatopsis sp. NPDC003861]
MNFTRVAIAAPLAVAALLALAVPASAHTGLASSSPAEGASLTAAPTEIKLTFDEPVGAEAGAVSVTGDDGRVWTVGKPTVKDKDVTVPVQPSGPAGRYTITYKVSSDDGDAVTGKVAFTLTAAAAPTTTSAAAPSTTPTSAPQTSAAPAPQAAANEDGGGVPVWVWIVLAVVVVATAVAVVARRSRGKETKSD